MLGIFALGFAPENALAGETAMPANIMVEAISNPNVLGISISIMRLLHLKNLSRPLSKQNIIID